MNILEGRLTLEKKNSKINGQLTVVRDLIFGTYIMGGGLPQSGGLARSIWKTTLNTIDTSKNKVSSCLILGLGGGGLVKLLSDKWLGIEITGVDIDPVIVELGKKYLKFDKHNVDVVIEDAEEFVKEAIERNEKYDLICIDTYIGEEFPKKFASKNFVMKVKKLLNKYGMAIFNRLYGPEDMKLANDFGKTLEDVFSNVDRVYPEANIMFVCF